MHQPSTGHTSDTRVIPWPGAASAGRGELTAVQVTAPAGALVVPMTTALLSPKVATAGTSHLRSVPRCTGAPLDFRHLPRRFSVNRALAWCGVVRPLCEHAS